MNSLDSENDQRLSPEQQLAAMRDFLETEPSILFCASMQEIVSCLHGFYEYDWASSAETAELMVLEFIIVRKLEEATWELTDCDRLDAAFVELESSGIVARQHYCDCRTSGGWSIIEECDQLLEQGKEVRGYTFYSQADREAAVVTNDLYSQFETREGDQADIEFGLEICSVLRRHGLSIEWNDDPNTAILVKITDWRKRLNCSNDLRRKEHD